MSDFIGNPNLTEKKVKKIICGTDDKKILEFFQKENVDVIRNAPNMLIDSAVASHADMSALHLGNSEIIVDCAQNELIKILNTSGMKVYLTEKEISGEYPSDIKLNFAVFGDYAVGNFRYIDSNLEKLLLKKKKINVKQGYCKCSVLIVSDNAVITDDRSIHREVRKNGIESLFISKGDVTLQGHKYGFIGGASGKISQNTVVFFGDIRKHRDFADIKTFIEKQNCTFFCTDNDPLRDIGGIVSVIEE